MFYKWIFFSVFFHTANTQRHLQFLPLYYSIVSNIHLKYIFLQKFEHMTDLKIFNITRHNFSCVCPIFLLGSMCRYLSRFYSYIVFNQNVLIMKSWCYIPQWIQRDWKVWGKSNGGAEAEQFNTFHERLQRYFLLE